MSQSQNVPQRILLFLTIRGQNCCIRFLCWSELCKCTAFHQIQSKPGVINCTEKESEDIKILWDRGVLSCFCHCVSVCTVRMLLNGPTKQTFPGTFQNPIAFMDTEYKKLFLQAMTAITTTVLNKKALALHREYQNLKLYWDIRKTNKSNKLWNVTQQFPGKTLANTENLVWIYKYHLLCSILIFYFKSKRPIRQHMRETNS